MAENRLSPIFNLNNERGVALIFVMVLLSVVSLVLIGSGLISDSNMDNSQLMWSRKRTFYVAEALRHVTLNVTKEYFSKTVSPGVAGLQSELESRLPAILAATSNDYFIEHPSTQDANKIHVELVGSGIESPIPNGPYIGMAAPQFSIQVRFNVARRGDLTSSAVSRVDMMVNLAQIALTQFYKFYSTSMYHGPASRTEERGHIHVNGDYCVGAATGGIYFQRITASGRLMHANDPRCPMRSGTDNSLAYIATDNTYTNFTRLTNLNDNACVNCDGSGMDWSAYAPSHFNGMAADTDNGVAPLVLPNTSAAKVQARWDQYGKRIIAPSQTEMRFIIDPILPDDPENIKQQKLAHRAGLRIVNGVWYIPNPVLPNQWPGMPIWSDHPGRAQDMDGNPVGQDDIRDLWATQGKPWGPEAPKGYSYYEYNPATRSIASDQTGVVSYGSMARTTDANRLYKPGYWLDSLSASAPLCGGSAAINCADDASNGNCGVQNAFNPISCPSGVSPELSTKILKGTRSGFINAYFQANSEGTPDEQRVLGHVLPMNIDVEQLQLALQNTLPGELGTHVGTDFNGLVYVTNSWKGSLNGFTDNTVPDFWPSQGALTDASQMPTTSAAEQQALPYQLCSSHSSLTPGGLAGTAFDEGPDSNHRFVIPDCAAYETDTNPSGTQKAFVNAVRVVNGKNISGAGLPKGISIVSNLPVYLVGDFNTSSDASTSTATPWVSTMIAGDKVYQISNNWLDERAPWGSLWHQMHKPATSTTYQTALLGVSGQNLLEDWRLQTLSTKGAIASVYTSAYSRHGYQTSPIIYRVPASRSGVMDPHFDFYSNRPPGAPEFGITSLYLWNKP